MLKSKRVLTLVLALTLLVTCAIGGTVAWLVTQTDPITNTFTIGDINIAWKDDTTSSSLTVVPGQTTTQSATVTVKAGSEACWLFIKVSSDVTTNDDFNKTVFTFTTTSDGWTQLDGQDGVWYKEISNKVESDTDHSISYTTTVNSEITKADLTKITKAEVTIVAGAIQKSGFDTAADAFAELFKTE